MLRVLEKARPKCPIEISSTFCGAHSVPKGSTAAEVACPLSHLHHLWHSREDYRYSCIKYMHPVTTACIQWHATVDNCLYSGNHRRDRETTPSSFEAEGGRWTPIQNLWTLKISLFVENTKFSNCLTNTGLKFGVFWHYTVLCFENLQGRFLDQLQ